MTKTIGGKGNEPLWKSRRIWGAILAGVSAVAVSLGYPQVAAALAGIGSIFGITSWVKPK